MTGYGLASYDAIHAASAVAAGAEARSLVLIEPHPRIANSAGSLLLVGRWCPAILVVRKEKRHYSLVNLVGRSLWPRERELIAGSVHEHRQHLMRKRVHCLEKTLYSQMQVKRLNRMISA